MKRRSSTEVRQLLLDAGARVFREQGFQRATTDQIAEVAGVSMSVLFRHFPTKGDLFREAIIQPFIDSLAAFATTWRESFADPVDEAQIMRHIVAELYDSLRGHEDAVAALSRADGSLDEDTADEIAGLFDQCFAQMRDMGQAEAARRTWFSGEEMELTSRLLVALVTACVSHRRWFLPTGRQRLSRERIVDHITNLMVYGLRLGPGEPNRLSGN
ncbi:TetR/AcrR family transcriptional regulator [Mycolicibacterium sp. jd]|uniref:TetR/AcrR family transcriptional regulator n=1 Tax=unclassified Mycolicibacterium TaxID=2636767 RepID=UPI00351B1F07